MDEVEDLGDADIGHGLIDNLPDLDRGDADGERRAEHDTVFAQGLTGDHRRKLNHQARPGIQIAVPKDLVEREIIEGLDQFRVGHGQGGDVPREQLVVVSSGLFVGSHYRFSWRRSLPDPPLPTGRETVMGRN